jgi:hypothetical protein
MPTPSSSSVVIASCRMRRPSRVRSRRRAGLALADAFDLGGVEGIELPPALALLLGTDLLGARQRPFQSGLEIGLAGDLAADIAIFRGKTNQATITDQCSLKPATGIACGFGARRRSPPHNYSIVAPTARRIRVPCPKKTFATLRHKPWYFPYTLDAPDDYLRVIGALIAIL